MLICWNDPSGGQPAELPIEIQHACADDLAIAIEEWQGRWADREEPGASDLGLVRGQCMGCRI